MSFLLLLTLPGIEYNIRVYSDFKAATIKRAGAVLRGGGGLGEAEAPLPVLC